MRLPEPDVKGLFRDCQTSGAADGYDRRHTPIDPQETTGDRSVDESAPEAREYRIAVVLVRTAT